MGMDRVLGRHIVTGKGFPDWLKEVFASGKGKVNTEDGEFQSITLYTTSGTMVAHVGDTILKTKSGVVMVPKAAAKKHIDKEVGENAD